MSVSLVLTWSWVQFTLICPRKLGPYWLWHHVCKNGKNMAEPLRLCLDENVLQNFLGELQNKQTASWTTDEKIDMCFFFSLTVWTNSITWQINTYIPIHCKVDVVFPQTTNKQKKPKGIGSWGSQTSPNTSQTLWGKRESVKKPRGLSRSINRVAEKPV